MHNDEKFTLFIPSKDEILVKKPNFFAREEDRLTSVGSNFLCGRPHGADYLPVRMRHLSLPPLPSVWTS